MSSFAAQYCNNKVVHMPLDWLTFPGVDIVEAPHPDLFESELDVSLSTYDQAQLDQLSIDFHATDPFSFRSATPTCGPLSTFTVSSESAYGDSLSSRSESLYGAFSAPNPSIDDFAADLEFMSFATAPMPESPPDFDLEPSVIEPTFYSPPSTIFTHSTSLSPPPQRVTEHHRPPRADGTEPRKKYSCNQCSRSFARAFNLKTHIATHDPNRPKPHVCPTCNRSFSRKHDLGRHLVSIHKNDPRSNLPSTPTISSCKNVPPTPSINHPSLTTRKHVLSNTVGLGRGSACQYCGKSCFGKMKECACEDE